MTGNPRFTYRLFELTKTLTHGLWGASVAAVSTYWQSEGRQAAWSIVSGLAVLAGHAVWQWLQDNRGLKMVAFILLLVSGQSAIADPTTFNSALVNVGHGSAASFDPVYIPGKTFSTAPGLTINYVGGRINTGGGLRYFLQENHRGVLLGSDSTIVFTGPDSGPCIKYQGYGWFVGPLNFFGFPVASQADYAAALAGKFDGQRRAVGLEVSSAPGISQAVGRLHAEGMTFVGFQTAVHVDSGVTNGDRLHWGDFGIALCNVGLRVDSNQSACNSIDNFEADTACDRAFEFHGCGDFTVGSCVIEGGPCDRILKVDGDCANAPHFAVHHLHVDNTAIPGTHLVELGSSLRNAIIEIDGEYGNAEAIAGYPDAASAVLLPEGWDAGTLVSRNIQIKFDVAGIVPPTPPASAAAYSR